MRLVIRKVINKICCDKMKDKIANGKVTHNEWNFFYGEDVIFYCPFCGEACY